MADVYAVTPEDVSAELPGLFPVGFTQATKPTRAQVIGWISRADIRVSVAAQQLEESSPDVYAQAVPGLATEYIIASVKGKVLQAVYAGNDPAALGAVLQPAFSAAKDALQALKDLAIEIEEETESEVGQPIRASESTPLTFVW